MLDIKFVRTNPDAVKENIKKKFQDEKLPLVDEVIELDSQRRANIQEADQLRSDRNRLSKQVGMLMGQAKKDPSKLAEAEAVKKQVTDEAERKSWKLSWTRRSTTSCSRSPRSLTPPCPSARTIPPT